MNSQKQEGRKAPLLGSLLFHLYGTTKNHFFRRGIRSLVLRLEGGETHSLTIRRIFSKYHYREIGLYSAAGSFALDAFRSGPPVTIIGRYTSITLSVRAFGANHPLDWKSTHAFFYNPSLGLVEKDLLEQQRTKLTIGNDVWIGHNAILLPSVSSVGDGAVIAAGSVVFQNVPPYAIVGGYPARIMRYRFSPATIEKLLASKWWEKPIDELRPELESFQRPWESAS